jgi:hypothetical protein
VSGLPQPSAQGLALISTALAQGYTHHPLSFSNALRAELVGVGSADLGAQGRTGQVRQQFTNSSSPNLPLQPIQEQTLALCQAYTVRAAFCHELLLTRRNTKSTHTMLQSAYTRALCRL